MPKPDPIRIYQVRADNHLTAEIAYMINSGWCPCCGEHNTWESQRKVRKVPMKWANAVLAILKKKRDWTEDRFRGWVVYTFFSDQFNEVKKLDKD